MHHARKILDSSARVLSEVAKPIPHEEVSKTKTQSLIREMKALLEREDLGVALAAPQVGESIRLFVVSGRVFQKHNKDGKPIGTKPDDLVFINPEIVRVSRTKKDMHEGCLSLRGKWGIVPRAEKMTLRAHDQHGKIITRNATGLLAHIFQHELDHLEGILYDSKAKLMYDDSEAEKIEARGH